MGPCGYRRPPSSTIPFSGYYVIFILCAAFMSVTAFPQGNPKCQVEQCINVYNHAERGLMAEEFSLQEKSKLCSILRTFQDCVSNAKDGCYGDLNFHTHKKMATLRMQSNNCTLVGERLKLSKDNKPVLPAKCRYSGAKTYRHCSLFGDPHLRTFYEEFQTCKVKGAWPLINNDYLTVQVTNVAVEGNVDATATSKLTVIVKGNSTCMTKEFQTYQAQSNSLPSTFVDERTEYGPYGGLQLVEVDPGKHVEIHIRYIDTVIIIRQIGRYFTFSIKMPEDLLNSSRHSEDLQLCVGGCPAAEQIRYQEYLANRNRTFSAKTDVKVEILDKSGNSNQLTWDYAEKVCREAKVVDFYYDSCVFDLMSTGDLNFTLSALGALQDMVKLNPTATQTWMNRSRLVVPSNKPGNGCPSQLSPSWHRLQLVLLLFLTCVVRVLSRGK